MSTTSPSSKNARSAAELARLALAAELRNLAQPLLFGGMPDEEQRDIARRLVALAKRLEER